MGVMQVGCVRMIVRQRVVPVNVAVGAHDRRGVRVIVMPVVVPVRMLVHDGLVGVEMPVALGEMKNDAQPEETAGSDGRRPGLPLAEAPSDERAYERRHREYRPGPCSSDLALGQ